MINEDKLIEALNRQIDHWRTSQNDAHGINTAVYVALSEFRSAIEGAREPGLTVKLPEGISQVLRKDIARQNDKSTHRVCTRCHILFERGDFCFYDLCNHCFGLFDAQKMKGRLRPDNEPMTHFEDAEAWAKANPSST